jgi:ABC-type branched-subunit amino acid transport system ATPase component
MMLCATDISIRFGGIQALKGVSVEIAPGQVVSVIGPNGSGKSTLFNAITGFVPLQTGVVTLDGRKIQDMKPHERVRLGISRTFQTPRINPEMTVLDAIKCGMAAIPASGLFGACLATPRQRREEREIEERAHEIISDLGLAKVRHSYMGELPMGTVRLIDVGRAAISQPKFILLDEPAAGLSHQEQDVLKAQIQRLAAAGVGVLLVEHNFRFVTELADHLAVLERGELIANGTPEEVRRRPEFINAYLGSLAETAEASEAEAIADSADDAQQAPVLTCRGMTARYGSIQVCFDVDLDVRRAEVVALLGANGAGKSSLLGALGGLVQSGGEVRLDGEVISTLPAHKRASKGIALVPEIRGNIFPTMSVDENIEIALRRLAGDERPRKEAEIIEMFPRLAERRQSEARMLSGGEQQMLAVAMALCQNPKVLLLDEPTQGLAPAVYDILEDTIHQVTAKGIGVILAEQNLGFAQRLADRVVVLAGGSVSFRGGRKELQDQDAVMRAYMGAEVQEVVNA